MLSITACGENCTGCLKKADGRCKGCIETDGHCEEWAGSGRCPIHSCAREHGVLFCGLCEEFPCDWLVKKVTWQPDMVRKMTELARICREQKE